MRKYEIPGHPGYEILGRQGYEVPRRLGGGSAERF